MSTGEYTATTPPGDDATEDDIAVLVTRFYDRARKDPELGPVLGAAIDDWERHHRIVIDFWSRTLLGTSRYRGHPYGVHARLPLRPEHFMRWLDLFRRTAAETLPAAAARCVVARAEHMAESFKAGLFTFEQRLTPVHGQRASARDVTPSVNMVNEPDSQ